MSKKHKEGFSLLELLIGLSVSVAIFIVATSLMVQVFSMNTKSKQKDVLSQVKNDLQNEFSNSIRWADNISYVDGVLKVDETSYSLNDGKLLKDDSSLTPMNVEITSFEITRQSPASVVVSGSGSGLMAQYYNDSELHDLVFTQQDSLIDFDWGTGSPDKLIDGDTFSIRFTGQVKAPANGMYTFFTEADERVKLWVADTLIIDDWGTPGMSVKSGKIVLRKDDLYDIRVVYAEDFGTANMKLSWSYPGTEKQVVPTSSLYPRTGPTSLEIKIGMKDKSSISLVDSLTMILSPRSGSVSTVE